MADIGDVLSNQVLFSELSGAGMVGVGVVLLVVEDKVEVLLRLTWTELLVDAAA